MHKNFYILKILRDVDMESPKTICTVISYDLNLLNLCSSAFDGILRFL